MSAKTKFGAGFNSELLVQPHQTKY